MLYYRIVNYFSYVTLLLEFIIVGQCIIIVLLRVLKGMVVQLYIILHSVFFLFSFFLYDFNLLRALSSNYCKLFIM